MKLSKKIAAAVLTATLVFGTSITVFAASEADIIAALKAANVPANYITQAENYLATHQVSSSEADAVISKIQAADAIVDKAGGMNNVSSSETNAILAYVQSAADVLGLSATIATDATGEYVLVVDDSSGNTVTTVTANQVKQTGSDNTMFIIGALLFAGAAGSAFVIKKKLLA